VILWVYKMKIHIKDKDFERIYEYLKHERNIHCGNYEKIRKFFEAIYWMARSGAQWRFLPEEYGKWNTVYQRFEEWSAKGIWKRMFQYFSADKDLEWLMIDSTIVRAHACSVGAKGGAKFKPLDEAKADIAPRFI
jgi:transposase